MVKPTKTLTFKLAKLMIAVAWADGVFHTAELNALKTVLFSLPHLTGQEWAELEIYMDSPVQEQERTMLMNDVIASIRNRSDKKLVLQTVEALLAADGHVSAQEQGIFNELKGAIESKTTGLLSVFSNLTGIILAKRMETEEKAIVREGQIEDFVRNRILYDLKRNCPQLSRISESQLKKLCSAAALLGRIAVKDGEFAHEEQEAMISVLVSEWGLQDAEAKLLTEIVRNRVTRGIDYHFLTHYFFEQTTREERNQFIKCLFRIANASNQTTHHEIEEIRSIAKCLKVSHADFIEAKLTIPRADRNGL